MKTNITITVDSEVIAEARAKGIKVSQILNSYLRTFLSLPAAKENYDIDKLSRQIEQTQAKLQKEQEQYQNIQEKIKKGEIIL